LTTGGRSEHFRGSHAGIEKHDLVAGVHDRGILLKHDIFGRQEIVAQHLLQLFICDAGKGALGRAERQRTVGDDGDLGIAQTEAIEVGWLRLKLGRSRESAAEHGYGAKPCTEGKQGPSRNIVCHDSPPLYLWNCRRLALTHTD